MQEKRSQFVQKTVETGISFGSALAMVISYTTWHSIGWAISHCMAYIFGLFIPDGSTKGHFKRSGLLFI